MQKSKSNGNEGDRLESGGAYEGTVSERVT